MMKQAYEPRTSRTLQEHCDHANAQLILNGTNDARRKQGIGAVHWVIRNGRVVCEWDLSANAIADGRRMAETTQIGSVRSTTSGGAVGNRTS